MKIFEYIKENKEDFYDLESELKMPIDYLKLQADLVTIYEFLVNMDSAKLELYNKTMKAIDVYLVKKLNKLVNSK